MRFKIVFRLEFCFLDCMNIYYLFTLFLLKLRNAQNLLFGRCFNHKNEAEILNGKYGCNKNANIKVLDQVDGKSHGAGGEHQNVHFGAQLHCFVLYKRFQMFMVQFCSQKPTVESVRTFGKEKRSCQKQRCGGQSGDYNAYRTAYQTEESQSQIDIFHHQDSFCSIL